MTTTSTGAHYRRDGWCDICQGAGRQSFTHIDLDADNLSGVTSPETTSELALYDDARTVALQAAVEAMAGCFCGIAGCTDAGAIAAAHRVTAVADVFVAWLRQVRSISLTLVSIEEQDGTVVTTSPGGTVTTIDTSQQARYVISAADDRGFPVDAALTAESSDTAVATVELLEATSGTASGKDELVVTAVAPGSALVRVFDATNPDIFGSDAVDVIAGGVATVVLEAPVVEEQPVPEPEPPTP